jgi:F0F1-type ATP synthase beta subunit
LFSALPSLAAVIVPADDLASAPPVAVVSHVVALRYQ